jgi:hypothetical protein
MTPVLSWDETGALATPIQAVKMASLLRNVKRALGGCQKLDMRGEWRACDAAEQGVTWDDYWAHLSLLAWSGRGCEHGDAYCLICMVRGSCDIHSGPRTVGGRAHLGLHCEEVTSGAG